MIRMVVGCDISTTSVHDAILRLCAEYGSADGATSDRFILTCGEAQAPTAARVIDEVGMRQYRITLIVMAPALWKEPYGWQITRVTREGVYSEGCG